MPISKLSVPANPSNPSNASNPSVLFAPARKGDVKHSLADISLAGELLGYEVGVDFNEGIRRTVEWYLNL